MIKMYILCEFLCKMQQHILKTKCFHVKKKKNVENVQIMSKQNFKIYHFGK